MESSDRYVSQPKIGKRWHWFLVGLPIATAVLMVSQTGLRSAIEIWSSQVFNKVDVAYRYPYPDALSRTSPTLRIEQEIAFYQQRVQQRPEGAIDQASLALSYLRMAQMTGEGNWYLLADQAAQASLAKLPYNNSEALVALARIAEARHDFAGALKLADQLPNPREAIAIQATTYLAMGKLPEASSAVDALVDSTLSTTSFTLQGLVRIAQGKDSEGIQSFQQAIAIEEPGDLSSSAQVRTLLGRFYYERGDLERAQALHHEALRVLPNSPQAKLNLAQLEIRRGRYGVADRLYADVQAAAQGKPTVYDPLVLRGQAKIKLLQGDRAGAEQHWSEAETLLRQSFIGANTGSFGHRRDLARLLLERGHDRDIPEAVALMETELKIRRSADTLDTYAWALARAHRWQDAQTAIQASIAQGIHSAGIFDRAGTIEQSLGNPAAAERYFEQSRQTDPTFDDAARQAIGLGVGLGF
jgi:tetratricopeptide (TPR) repeat protein